MEKIPPKPPILSLGLALLLAASAFFSWVWYERYLSLDFNRLGRYYDATTGVVYTDSGFAWVIPALVFFALAAIRLAVAIRLRTRAGKARNATGREAAPRGN